MKLPFLNRCEICDRKINLWILTWDGRIIVRELCEECAESLMEDLGGLLESMEAENKGEDYGMGSKKKS